MARSRPGSGGPRAEASRAYRAEFAAKHGISFNAARRLARALDLPAGAPARAASAVVSTPAGLGLLGYGGPDPLRQALRHEVEKALELRVRAYGALGVWGQQGVPLRPLISSGQQRQFLTEIEHFYELAPGTLARTFGSEALATGRTDLPVPMNVIGPDGSQLILAVSQVQRELIGQYWHAVGEALRLGTDAPLQPFRGQRVGGVPLETDLRRLRVLEDAGELVSGPYPGRRSGWA